jgi:hypothetical protein
MAETLFFDDQAEYKEPPPVGEELAAAEEAVAGRGEIKVASGPVVNTSVTEAPKLNSAQKRRRMQNAIKGAQRRTPVRNVPAQSETKTGAQRHAELVDAKTQAAIKARLGTDIGLLVSNLKASGRLDSDKGELQKFRVARSERTAKLLDLLQEEGYLLAEDNEGGQAHYLDPTGWVVANLLVDGSLPKYDKYLLLGGNRGAARSYIADELRTVTASDNAE